VFLHSAAIIKTIFLVSNAQIGPVLAVVAAIAFAGIAIIFVALKKE
jgi:hypothetical protein